MLITILALLLVLALWPLRGHAGTPKHWPTSKAAQRWKPDRDWLRGAFCVHRHESIDWHLAYRDWAGNPSPYSGGMQFLRSTWQNAGGLGDAWQWSPREQLYRAFVVWRRDGGSWSEWGTRGACGLR